MLPPVIDCTQFTTLYELVEHAYVQFEKLLVKRETRGSFYGNWIWVDEQNWADDKLDIFWHVIGLSPSERFDVFPCSNHPAQLLCKKNCISRNWEVQTKTTKKAPCAYRAIRVAWINQLITASNLPHHLITIFEDDGSTCIRYQNDLEDFVIVLDPMVNIKNCFKLTTAYPVFYIRRQVQLDKAYERHNKQQIEKIEKMAAKKAIKK